MASSAVPAVDEPSPSLLGRVGRVFAQPTKAWAGLQTRSQWWFPMLIMMIATGISGALLHQRAIVPMTVARWERMEQDGKMSAEQVQKMQDFMTSPVGLAVVVCQQVILSPILSLLAALMIWFGCGFILGTRLKYRLALEVAAWSSLVSLPTAALVTALGWMKESMQGLHTGFGILLPDSDTPSKLMTGLGAFLDGIGPFAIWYLAVVVIGAAALSGAKRKSVAWVLGGLYLAVLVFMAAMAGMFTPAA